MERKDVFTLDTIVYYCDRIDAAIKKFGITKERLLNDPNLQDMLAFCIIQIGECVNDLSASFVNSHTEIEWHKISKFRTLIVHHYGDFVPEILWDAVQTKIPELREFCLKQIKP